MKPKKANMIVIGLDGVSYPLLQQWTAAGFLPNIGRLMSSGTFGQHRTVPNMNSAPAWTSFSTGCNPGKHGIYYFYERLPGGYTIRYLNGGDCRTPRFWTRLNEAGKATGIMNVPMTYPADPVKGFMLAGLDAPGTSSRGFSYPAGVIKEVKERGLQYMIEPGITGYVAAGNMDSALSKGFEAIDARTETLRYLQEHYACDVLVVVYRMADVVQHYFWHFHDPTHPRYHEQGAENYRDAVRRTYQKLDEAVGSLTGLGDDETVYALLSDHGAGAAEGGVGFLRDFLISIGCLKTANRQAAALGSVLRNKVAAAVKKTAGAAYRVVQKHTSRRLKERLLQLFPGMRNMVEATLQFSDIAWQSSQAYCARDRTELWINMKGREPAGTVEPGDEYRQVCAYITERLLQWRNPGSGEPVVKRVQQKEELYDGPCTSSAPDLLVTWHDGVYVKGVAFQETDGTLRVAAEGNPQEQMLSGKHLDEGFFLLAGPHIFHGREIAGVRIEDIAPTLLYLADVPVPGIMDGRVITDAIDPAYLKDNPVRIDAGGPGTTGVQDSPQEYTKEELSEIEKRLRDLGYIE